MAELTEEAGTRYEIHIQNEDGTPTGEVIVIYSNEGNDPAQVQELVTKALAELAKQNQEEAVIVADQGDGTSLQTEVYGHEVLATSTEIEGLAGNNVVQGDHTVIKMEMDSVQQPGVMTVTDSLMPHVMEEQVLKVEIDAPNGSLPRQEVYTALNPEDLEMMGMTQVENEFTAKAVPYKLKAVDPEELLDIEQDLNLNRRRGRRPKAEEIPETETILVKDIDPPPQLTTEEGEGNQDNKPEVKVLLEKLYSCSVEGCSFMEEDEIVFQRHMKIEHGEETPFKCSYCSKEFRLELSLHIHLLGHKDIPALGWEVGSKARRQFNCFVCFHQCSYRRQILQHMKDDHDMDVLTCDRCKMAFPSDEELQAHLESEIHHENLWTMCTLCGISSKNISQHMKRMHSTEKPYQCSTCEYSCKFYGALKAHMLVHSSERAFKCEHCEYAARSKDQLKRHEVVHSTTKDHKCPNCPYATQTIYRLKKHMKIHTNTTKGYRCIMCDFVTHDKLILKQHKVDVHSKKMDLGCNECNLKFQTVQELKVHAMSVHKCTNNWFCKFCDFSCETRRDLGKHMQVHAGKHRYVCKICGYSCRQSNPFKRHLARHSKVKAFNCSMCNYSCTDKYDLEKHIITHSEQKTVQCPECSYTCRYKAQLVRHTKLVHEEVKPYFCTFCSYTTKSPQNLKNHMHLHAEKKPHQCVLCDFSACQKSNLKRHMQTHLKKAQIVFVQ